MSSANISRLGAVLFNTESSFAEDSATFGTRLLPVNAIDVSGLNLGREEISILQQRGHEGISGVNTTFEASFTIELLLTGHGGATTGALTATDLATLLGHAIGNLNTSQVGTTATGTGTANAFGVNGGTIANHGLIRVGSLADARGNGQFAAVSVSSGGTVTLLTDLAGAPDAADVVYVAQFVHPSETAANLPTVQSLRFRLITSNEHYDCHGCFPTAISFSGLNAGEVPKVSITYTAARFDSGNETFPDATAHGAKDGAVIAGGSFFANQVGVATRQTFALRDFGVTFNLENAVLRGPGGVAANQVITGVCRTKLNTTISATFDAEATGTQTFYDAYKAGEYWHALWTGSVEDGKAIGMYWPRLKFVAPLPVQSDMDGLNRVKVMWESLTSADTVNELSLANFILGMG